MKSPRNRMQHTAAQQAFTASKVGCEHTRDGVDVDRNDAVARFVNTQFRYAVRNRQNERAGGHSVEQRLWHAKWQSDYEFEPAEQELIDDTGVDLYLPVSATKAETVFSFMRDMMLTNPELIRFEATPVPSLSAREELEIVKELRKDLANAQQLNELELEETARTIKTKFLQLAQQRAGVAAAENQTLMKDRLVESRILDKLVELLRYVIMYPYAVMLYPVVETVQKLEWSSGKAKFKTVDEITAKTIDPMDYYWSTDCVGANTGYAEMVVDTLSRADMQKYAGTQKKNWNKEQVAAAIDFYSSRGHYDWMRTSNRKGTDKPTIPWGNTDTIEVVQYFGKMPADEIRKYGKQVSEGDHEVHAIVCGPYTLFFNIIPKSVKRKRPTLVTSWQKRPKSLCGKGLAYVLRDLQRAGNMSLRHLIVNAGYASAPSGEVDIARVQKYFDSPEEAYSINPGMFIPVEPDMVNQTAQPAYRFAQIPDRITQFSGLLTVFMQLADYYSHIPALLSGTPVGSGAMRTFRGMLQYQANSMRVIQSAFSNIDSDILEPIGEYDLHRGLQNGEYTGDSNAAVYGFGGLLKDELEAQRASENLQIISQMAGAAPQLIPAEAMEWTIQQLLSNSGIPKHLFNS